MTELIFSMDMEIDDRGCQADNAIEMELDDKDDELQARLDRYRREAAMSWQRELSKAQTTQMEIILEEVEDNLDAEEMLPRLSFDLPALPAGATTSSGSTDNDSQTFDEQLQGPWVDVELNEPVTTAMPPLWQAAEVKMHLQDDAKAKLSDDQKVPSAGERPKNSQPYLTFSALLSSDVDNEGHNPHKHSTHCSSPECQTIALIELFIDVNGLGKLGVGHMHKRVHQLRGEWWQTGEKRLRGRRGKESCKGRSSLRVELFAD